MSETTTTPVQTKKPTLSLDDQITKQVEGVKDRLRNKVLLLAFYWENDKNGRRFLATRCHDKIYNEYKKVFAIKDNKLDVLNIFGSPNSEPTPEGMTRFLTLEKRVRRDGNGVFFSGNAWAYSGQVTFNMIKEDKQEPGKAVAYLNIQPNEMQPQGKTIDPSDVVGTQPY